MWWLAALAWGQTADVVRSSAGVQATHSASLGQTDVDVLLGEKVRWRTSPGGRLWIDGAFTIDTDGATTFERSRVRHLGMELHREALRVWVGRHPVAFGGPRIVDGLQVIGQTGPWSVGGWAGLAPDLFTTRPELRPGGGPMIAWVQGRGELTLVGEVLGAQGGLDRAGAIASGRLEGGNVWDVSGRLDWQFEDAAGRSGLADGAVFGQLRPTDAFRIDVLYNAFSSYRYQQTTLLDPTIQRFTTRVDALALALGVAEESEDPTIHHMVGLTPRVHTRSVDVSVLARARLASDPTQRYERVQPRVGFRGPLDGRLELQLDANLVHLDTGWSESAGPTVLLELAADRSLWLDGSVRAVLDPAYEGVGGYADLFVDWMAPAGVLLMGGVAWEYEPVVELNDVGVTAYLRAQHSFGRSPRTGDADIGI